MNASYTHSFGFDGAARVATIMYPSATINHAYSAQGYFTKVINPADGTVLQEWKDTDAYGSPTLETLPAVR